MGVKGLRMFLDENKPDIQINIYDAVKDWRRRHRNQIPIIAIDFMNLLNMRVSIEENLCGGRHCNRYEEFRKLLHKLRSTGCKLVFFADLNVQLNKITEWLRRRNEEFKYYIKIYNVLDQGDCRTCTIAKKLGTKKALNSTFFGMASLAKEYGDFHYITEHDCDLELARYATENDAMAILSDDTDFLIFDGPWQLWSVNNLRMNLNTMKADRNGLLNMFGLSRNQLPILATLLGNDYTKTKISHSNRFNQNAPNEVVAVAEFVKKFPNHQLNDDELNELTKQLFGYINDDKKELIRASINSYNINDDMVQLNDPIADKLRELPSMVYRTYKNLMAETQGINLPFYDLKCGNVTALFVDWLRRKIGILKQNDTDTFILMAKHSANSKFEQSNESPILPNFAIPSLDQIFFDESVDIVAKKWTIFAWIMSFNEKVIEKLKLMPMKYLLIAATLYALVKNKIIHSKEADGILIAEHKVILNQCRSIQASLPNMLNSNFVRAAHIYNITFQQVRVSFHVSGLNDFIDDVSHFDGCYFQNLMNSTIDPGRIHADFNYLRDLNDYRIYYE